MSPPLPPFSTITSRESMETVLILLAGIIIGVILTIGFTVLYMASELEFMEEQRKNGWPPL